MPERIKYAAVLRGINVGGHHKIPMAELCREFNVLGFTNVSTLLNSGNVIFDTDSDSPEKTVIKIENRLQKTFGFPVPVILRDAGEIQEIIKLEPFKKIKITKDIRLYVSFLKHPYKNEMKLPHISENGSFSIIEVYKNNLFSVLDISTGKTTKGMEELEKLFGKEVTTRNWNTVNKIFELQHLHFK
ncbi:MAG TPA: DUF1697 domain-containing protein [Bacteroidetes bacterium]|nr:DUF1697 domain-containing protein [Bacteroidota bacterium]HRJ98288.1 DUF1697 domain-containing protein [Ignavibacteria bacterium]